VTRTQGRASAVDPSYRKGDLPGEVADRITLEHVHDVATFLREVRRGLEHTSGGVALFEVPDTRRILEEGAFWDLYYEHCSYFTPGSLARAFRSAGLAPARLERTFDDQYVFITATVEDGEQTGLLPEEETTDEVVALAERFTRTFEATKRHWKDRLGVARAGGARTVIWGAGSKGVGFLTMLGLDDEVAYAVDVNPDKHGMFTPGTGHEIVSPDCLEELQPDLVVVMNPAYVDEIASDLARRGIETELLTL
jgi:hypothetical protein